jgi:hypothetical protein
MDLSACLVGGLVRNRKLAGNQAVFFLVDHRLALKDLVGRSGIPPPQVRKGSRELVKNQTKTRGSTA